MEDLDAEPSLTIRMSELEIQRARAWVDVAAGDLPAAIERFGRAADEAQAEGELGTELTLRHDLVRLAATDRGAPRLLEVASVTAGPLNAARAELAAATLARDGEGLDTAAGLFADLGAMLFAAEAANEAAIAHRAVGDTRAAAASGRHSATWSAAVEHAQTPSLDVGSDIALLTKREREIALLAASGMASREIAATLVVSVRTIDNHLQHAYEKLGISGRGELTAAMAGAGY